MGTGSTDQRSDEPRVRFAMSAEAAAQLADRLALAPWSVEVQRLLDQLWLRMVLIEQWRRIRLSERQAFADRADRVLAALDPA